MYAQYQMALLTLVKRCDFGGVMPEEIIRDRLVFGTSYEAVRKKLLEKSDLALEQTDEICQSVEVAQHRLRKWSIFNWTRQRVYMHSQGQRCLRKGKE